MAGLSYEIYCRWLGIIGQFRPKKLISSIKSEFATGDEAEFPGFKDVARHLLDKSLYAFELSTQLSLASSSSIKLSTEGHGEKEGRRNKLMLFHKVCISFLIFKSYFNTSFIQRSPSE